MKIIFILLIIFIFSFAYFVDTFVTKDGETLIKYICVCQILKAVK